MKKKGIELSVNFLVVVILSIVILFVGVAFFKNLMEGANKIKENYDLRTAEELELLLTQGQRVAVPFPRQDARKGDTVVFGLGIYNALGYNSNFKVSVKCSSAFDGSNELQTACNDVFGADKEGQILWNKNNILIKNNERHTMPIPIYFPKGSLVPIATYVFNICVCKDENLNDDPSSPISCTDCGPSSFPANMYDAVHKVYVTIK